MRFSFQYCLLLFIFALFLGCSKSDENRGGTSLQITLKDERGSLLPGTLVKLYGSQRAMEKDSAIITWLSAGEDGKVTFPGLQPVRYFWYAAQGSKNNSDGVNSTNGPLTADIVNGITSILYCEGLKGTIFFRNDNMDEYKLKFEPMDGLPDSVFMIMPGARRTITYDPAAPVEYYIHVMNMMNGQDDHYYINSVCEGRDTILIP